MELVCIDKQTFEELRIRFCKFEERMTHICRPVEDRGLKNWLDNQEAVSYTHLDVYKRQDLWWWSKLWLLSSTVFSLKS